MFDVYVDMISAPTLHKQINTAGSHGWSPNQTPMLWQTSIVSNLCLLMKLLHDPSISGTTKSPRGWG